MIDRDHQVADVGVSCSFLSSVRFPGWAFIAVKLKFPSSYGTV